MFEFFFFFFWPSPWVIGQRDLDRSRHSTRAQSDLSGLVRMRAGFNVSMIFSLVCILLYCRKIYYDTLPTQVPVTMSYYLCRGGHSALGT